jgi:hypothetical protein
VDKAAGQRREDGHVLGAASFGRGDKEDEVCGTVGGGEVHAGTAAGKSERRLGDERRPGVRDADAALDACGHLLIALAHVGEEAVEVGDPSLLDEPQRELAGCAVPVGRHKIKVDEFRCDDGVGHGCSRSG